MTDDKLFLASVKLIGQITNKYPNKTEEEINELIKDTMMDFYLISFLIPEGLYIKTSSGLAWCEDDGSNTYSYINPVTGRVMEIPSPKVGIQMREDFMEEGAAFFLSLNPHIKKTGMVRTYSWIPDGGKYTILGPPGGSIFRKENMYNHEVPNR